MPLFKPYAFSISRKDQICMTGCVSIIGFKQSLSLLLSLGLSDVGVQSLLSEHINFDSSARPGWMTLNEVSGSSLPTSISGRSTGFLLFMYVRDRPHFTALHIVTEDKPENTDFIIYFCSHDVSFKPVPSISS